MARRTGNRRNRHLRNLQQQKGTGLTVQARPPLSSDGEDGDQMVVGQKLYIKVNGRWMPFKSGTGNINDGWHGSQRYIKLLPRDFIGDNETMGHSTSTGYGLYFSDSIEAETDYASQKPLDLLNPTDGSLGIGIYGAAITEYNGMGCSVPIPLGYWAIACKLYCSHIIAPGGAVTRTDGTVEGGPGHVAEAGVMVYNANLETGAATTALTSIGATQSRIVFDSAILGKNSNYCWIFVNDLPNYCAIYGGYIEIVRVKTAEALAEESEGDGGDVLARGG